MMSLASLTSLSYNSCCFVQSLLLHWVVGQKSSETWGYKAVRATESVEWLSGGNTACDLISWKAIGAGSQGGFLGELLGQTKMFTYRYFFPYCYFISSLLCVNLF